MDEILKTIIRIHNNSLSSILDIVELETNKNIEAGDEVTYSSDDIAIFIANAKISTKATLKLVKALKTIKEEIEAGESCKMNYIVHSWISTLLSNISLKESV